MSNQCINIHSASKSSQKLPVLIEKLRVSRASRLCSIVTYGIPGNQTGLSRPQLSTVKKKKSISIWSWLVQKIKIIYGFSSHIYCCHRLHA